MLSFIFSFIAARTFTTFYPSTVLISSGIHIHHFWFGLALLAIGGWLGISNTDSRFKILSWIGAWSETYGYADLSTPERRATLIVNEVTHVQNCHYDGTTIDLETGPYQGQESMYFNYFNDEATVMRLIGKTACPEIGAPAGLWQGNLDSTCQNFVSKLSGIDALNFGDSTNLGAGEWVCNIAGQEGNPGYIPTLMEFIQYW